MAQTFWPRSPIGRGARLKREKLWVRLPPWLLEESKTIPPIYGYQKDRINNPHHKIEYDEAWIENTVPLNLGRVAQLAEALDLSPKS